MNSQVCSCFNKLPRVTYSECLLCFSYSLPFDRCSLSQNRWLCNFLKYSDLLWSSSWWRLWANKCIMYSSKVDKICNKPFKEWNFLFNTPLCFTCSMPLTGYKKQGIKTHNGGRSRALQIKSRAGPSLSSGTTKCSTLRGLLCEGQGNNRLYSCKLKKIKPQQ